MLSEELSELATNTSHFLDNVTCPYCGDDLTQDNSNEEHVIGRRFIPKGKLDGEWNLVVRAHTTCNTVKSKLEDDISAITLAGRVWFDSDNVEQSLISEAQRKIKRSYSQVGRACCLCPTLACAKCWATKRCCPTYLTAYSMFKFLILDFKESC